MIDLCSARRAIARDAALRRKILLVSRWQFPAFPFREKPSPACAERLRMLQALPSEFVLSLHQQSERRAPTMRRATTELERAECATRAPTRLHANLRRRQKESKVTRADRHRAKQKCDGAPVPCSS